MKFVVHHVNQPYLCMYDTLKGKSESRLTTTFPPAPPPPRLCCDIMSYHQHIYMYAYMRFIITPLQRETLPAGIAPAALPLICRPDTPLLGEAGAAQQGEGGGARLPIGVVALVLVLILVLIAPHTQAPGEQWEGRGEGWWK